MTREVNSPSNKQNTRRLENCLTKLPTISSASTSAITITIVALLTLIACGGGGRIVIGIGGTGRTPRSKILCGLIGRIINESTARVTFHNTQFVSALPAARHCTSTSSFDDASPQATIIVAPLSTSNGNQMETCSDITTGSINADLMSSKTAHPNDASLWMYHVETTTSTMDEAKSIVGDLKLLDDDTDKEANDYAILKPTTFVISATSQSHGRGTTQRIWKSSQRGNALFTIGIQLSSWMDGLKEKNNGEMVPLTLLPLKVGSLVAFHIQKALDACDIETQPAQQKIMPMVTVKWPNDVLLRTSPTQGIDSHNKIAGILIESSQDWFLIGIGINVGYAPTIPLEGVDYGRRATSVSEYCRVTMPANEDDTIDKTINDDANNEEHWIKISKQLAADITYDLHSWLHHPISSQHAYRTHSGESILNQWKSYIDWDMQLVLRDTPLREHVTLKSVLDDGRVVVQEVETGVTRTLVSDYFL